MLLTNILSPACIKVPLDGKSKEAAISELVDLLDSENLLLDKAMALEAVLLREQTRSTGIGSAIAIPHGKCNAVKDIVMVVGISKNGIDFESVDNKPVKIILLLVSPLDKTGPHIQALSRISKLMLDEEFRQSFENAGSAEEIYELLSSREEI